jgi:hypothetical protein
MNRHDPQLARFLQAMAGERDDADALDGGAAAADNALRELLAGLPRPLPRPGFAERAALAAVMAGVPERRSAAAPRWRWALLAACLAATAGGVALLPVVLGAVRLALGRLSFAGATAAAARLMTLALGEVGTAAADLSSLWQRLISPVLLIQRALAAAVARPVTVLVVGLCLLISALALRFLHDLVERERSWNHAHPSR